MFKKIKRTVEKIKKYLGQGQDDFPGREDFLTHEEPPDIDDSLNQVDFVDLDD